ncbi:MAG TPA: hypothetical protein ACFYEK_09225, partial [Candidatus Wunengus sp. YC60]|uniref:hypothetical protein n=1 Tax=Candidatus Wunengus sp. YC60 TaxID=3367697 RepID=UPI004028F32A
MVNGINLLEGYSSLFYLANGNPLYQICEYYIEHQKTGGGFPMAENIPNLMNNLTKDNILPG